MSNTRKFIIAGIFIITGLVFLGKLFAIQVLDDSYIRESTRNSVRHIVEYPYRGLIYDRNGELIVYNKPEYDLIVTPIDVKNLDTATFCQVFNISKEDFVKKMSKAIPYLPSPFIKQVSHEEFAKAQDHLVNFSGFHIEARTVRAYQDTIMANALGYISEITKRSLEKDSADYYKQGDYIGQSGLESYYEEYLRGKRGVRFVIRNAKGIIKGKYQEGRYDTLSIPGNKLISTVDIKLQAYGERLMTNKSGSIVAIEPATGEILSIVSGPSYNPSLLSGRNYGRNFQKISTDSLKPLFNRPLMAQYRPGSIFKIMQALVALQEGVIDTDTYIPCNQSLIGCHNHGAGETLKGAITHSCNPYFRNVLKRIVNRKVSRDPFEDTRIGLGKWSEHIRSFGLGAPLGIDLPNEKSGLVPYPEYYDRAYRNRPWKFSNIYSIAIGEGENLVVPLQMANFAAIVANRGYYFTPHLIKSIGENGGPLPRFMEKKYTSVDPKHFDVAVEAMAEVIRSGTGQYRAKLKDIEVCGKTGTVQNDPLPDHSVFIAFAPKDNPKIAVSVYVEDAGQGARAAASIASLMIEQYLIGHTERQHIEDYVMRGAFL